MEADEVRRQLQARAFVPDNEYDIVRARSARNCHDVVLYLPEQGKILLAIRQQEPAKGFLWPFGGGQKLGLTLDESLARVVGKETGLTLSELEFFGRPIDHMWATGPRDIPVHDVGNYFTGIGHGTVRPDRNHTTRLIGPAEYTAEREQMAHWTRLGVERALQRFYGPVADDIQGAVSFPKYYVDSKPVF